MRRISAIAFSTMVGASLFAGGFGVGVQTSFDQGGGNAIAPRLDYIHATDSSTPSGPAAPVRLDAKVNILALGVDYNYFPGKQSGQGFYLLAGGGVADFTVHVDGSSAGATATGSHRKTTLFPEAGLGWLFTRNVGLELLYKELRYHEVDLAVGGEGASYAFSGALQASLVVRF